MLYERIKSLHLSGLLDAAGVRRAVTKGWLDAAEYEQITGHAY